MRLVAPEVVQAADHLEVLEAGQVLVDGRVLAGEPDLGAQLGRVAHGVQPHDPRAAGVGLEERREDPHRGGLAGPVRGPSRPSTLPARAVKSTPRSASTEPYDFLSPSTTIAWSVMRSTLANAGRIDGRVDHTSPWPIRLRTPPF